MPAAPIPPDEQERLDTLASCGVLDTPPEACFDGLTNLAARLCDTPIALVSLVDETRQWFKSRNGLDVTQTPRDDAFCAHAIHSDEPLIIPDARHDPRTADNPLVTGERGMRFYAGIPLKVSTGHRLGTLCVIDTRPREISPAQLADLKTLAEQATAQLELKLRNSLLNSAAKRAERANQSKSAFIANMSHEIRTPLTAIIGYAELIAEAQSNDEARMDPVELGQDICRNSRHLLALVNDVLDISRIESGRMRIERIPTDARAVVRDAVEIVSGMARDKGTELEARFDELPGHVMTDPTRLKQIALNLLGNAVKFTERGSVTVRLSYHQADQQLVMRVKDTGIGMTPAQLERVRSFDAFNQADETIARRFGGTGLGLRISRQLARLMDGDIDIDSAFGRGSTMTVTLRARPVDTPAANNQTPAQAARDTDTPSSDTKPLCGLHILVAEDGPDNQRLIRHHLEAAGACVTVVENGKDACEQLTQPQNDTVPDLVLMDMHMPVMDGYTATRRLRQLGCTLPVIALTASATDEDHQRCLSAGCDSHLAKPYDRAALIELCGRLARDERSAAAGRG